MFTFSEAEQWSWKILDRNTDTQKLLIEDEGTLLLATTDKSGDYQILSRHQLSDIGHVRKSHGFHS